MEAQFEAPAAVTGASVQAAAEAVPARTEGFVRARRGLGILATVLVGVLALGLGVLAALPAVGAHLLVVSSDSMTPMIAAGDAIVMTDTRPEEIAVGEVIVFRGYGRDRLTTHRVIGRHTVDGRLHFRTQGDANAAPDVDLAPAEGVAGKVVMTLPALGWALQALSDPLARLLLLAGPAAVIAALQLRDLLPGGARTERQPAASARRWLARLEPRVRSHAGKVGVAAALVAAAGAAHLALAGLGVAGAVLTDAKVSADNSFATADLVPPDNVTATFDCGTLGSGKGILVEWDAVGDAEGYELARSTESGGPYTTIATVDASTTSVMDTDVENDTTYFYVVRSTASGWSSENSAEASETTPSSTECLL